MGLGADNMKQYGDVPEIVKLVNGRMRVIRRFVRFSREDCDSSNIGTKLFEDFNSLDGAMFPKPNGEEPLPNQAFEDCRLISQRTVFVPDPPDGRPLLEKVYETLTDEFVQEELDQIDNDLNGLRRVTRPSIANPGTDYTSVVGETSIAHSIDAETAVTLYLATFRIEQTEGYRRVQEVWLQPGVLSTTDEDSNDGDLNTFTIRAWRLDSAEAAAAVSKDLSGHTLFSTTVENVGGYNVNVYVYAKGTGTITTSERTAYNGLAKITETATLGTAYPTPTGIVTNRTTRKRNGYTVYLQTEVTIQPDISWKTTRLVKEPGVVSATTKTVTDTFLTVTNTGTIAIPTATPPVDKRVATTVTRRITSTPGTSTSFAYDLSGLSASGVFTREVTNISVDSGASYSPSVRQQAYPGYRVSGAGATGTTVVYNTGSVSTATQGVKTTTEVELTGSSSDVTRTGLIRRNVNPVFTDIINNTVYVIEETESIDA